MNSSVSVLCPHCGSQVEPEDLYCDNCGNQLPDTPTATVGIGDEKLTRPIAGETLSIVGGGIVQPSDPGMFSEATAQPGTPLPNFGDPAQTGIPSSDVASSQWRGWPSRKITLIVGSVLLVAVLIGTGFYFSQKNQPVSNPENISNNELNKGATTSGDSNSSSPSSSSTSALTNEGLIAVPDKSKMGFMDSYGKLIVPGTYDKAESFSEGYAAVKMNGKWGLIDKTHNLVLDYVADSLGPVSEGMVPIQINTKWGYLDLKDIKDKKFTRLVIPAEYNRVSEFCNGLVAVIKGDRATYLNKSGNKAFPNLFELEDAWPFSEGVAAVKLARPVVANEPMALIDQKGQIIRTFSGFSAGKFVDGLMPVDDQGDSGFETWYVDKNMNKILGPYKHGDDFTDGLAGIYQGLKLGFIDKKGKVVIPCNYDCLSYEIRHGVISIFYIKFTYLDMQGNLIKEDYVKAWNG